MTSAFPMVSSQIRFYYIFANIIWILLWFVICYIGRCVYFYEYLNEKNKISSRLFVFCFFQFFFSLFLKNGHADWQRMVVWFEWTAHSSFFSLSSVCIHYSTAFNKQWNAMYDAKERGRETTARLNNTKLTWRDPVSCVWCILHRNTWSHSFKRRLSIHYWICQTFSYWTNETKTKCFS